jgi:hypothetical protein
MAFRTQKISQMTPKGADLEATDLIEVSTIESGSYVTRSITGQELIDAIPLPPSGLTIGTTPISSGTIGRVLFQGTGNVLQQSGNLFWDNTNNTLLIGGKIYATASLDIGRLNNAGVLFADNAQTALYNTTSTARLQFRIGPTDVARFAGTTGNFLINTSTDAGFRLDVNGTARVSDNLLLTNGIIATSAATTRLQGSLNYFTHNRIGSSGTLGFQIAQTNTLSSFWRWSDATDNVEFGNARNAPLCLFTNNTERLRIFGNGNVAINTTTDAGFRLDVNGTARVSGDLTTGGSQGILIGINGSGITAISNSVQINSLGANGTTNSFYWGLRNNFNVASATNNLHTYAAPITYAGGTNNATMLNIIPTINTSGGTTNVRGIYYNPTLTSLTGTTHHAFHSTSGRIRFENLPTSPVGLSSGDIWNNLGILTIV